MPVGGLPHLRRGRAVDGDPAAAGGDHLGATAAQHLGEVLRVRGAHRDVRAQPGTGEVDGALVGHQAPAFQGDDVVGGAGERAGVPAGEQDRAAGCRVPAGQFVHPRRLPRQQSASGVVEHERPGAGQQRDGEAEPAVHRQRERLQPLVGHGVQADQLQHLVGAGHRQPVGGAEHAQVPADGATRVAGHVAEDRSDLLDRVRRLVQGAAVDERDPASGLHTQQQSQRGGLARAGRPEQAGHLALAHLEGEVADGGRHVAPGGAGQSDGLDHLSTIALKSSTNGQIPANQTSGRSMGGLSSAAPPARNSCAGRPP